MDALTSFELEAQRRRETVANDRDLELARATATAASVDPAVRSRIARVALPARVSQEAECQPSSLARQSAG
jgi:hypothetical protein